MNDKIPCAECGKPISSISAGKRNGLCLTCAIKREEKVPCAECGKPTSARLAGKRDGLCLQCRAKRNPFFVLYSSLIDRACSPDGFRTLSEPEQAYYALTLFQNEVNNGGFHQFFFNSSGSYYDSIETGLVSFDEPQLLELLHQAKQIVFPDIDVPADIETRRKLLPYVDPASDRPQWATQLDHLDRRFYSTPDTLTAKLQTFARQRGLVLGETIGEEAS